jgi:hypothetical protein
MADDFYVFSAKQRLQEISAASAQAKADLEMAKAGGDYQSAASSVQQLADLESQRQNLLNLHDQYIRSQNPPAPPEPSREERQARSWDKMDAIDALNIARGSKYGKDLDFNDPNFVAGFHEAQARRHRGE